MRDQRPPLNPSSPEAWFTTTGFDGGAIDGLIRAETRIGALDCRTISLKYINNACKEYAPRVESPIIDSFTIDDFVTG